MDVSASFIKCIPVTLTDKKFPESEEEIKLSPKLVFRNQFPWINITQTRGPLNGETPARREAPRWFARRTEATEQSHHVPLVPRTGDGAGHQWLLRIQRTRESDSEKTGLGLVFLVLNWPTEKDVRGMDIRQTMERRQWSEGEGSWTGRILLSHFPINCKVATECQLMSSPTIPWPVSRWFNYPLPFSSSYPLVLTAISLWTVSINCDFVSRLH